MSSRASLTGNEAAFVRGQRVGRLATADADGHPHVVPVCYAFDGERFYTPQDEKAKRVAGKELSRLRNIEARHEAALVIDQHDGDWSRLAYLRVYGREDLLAPGDVLH